MVMEAGGIYSFDHLLCAKRYYAKPCEYSRNEAEVLVHSNFRFWLGSGGKGKTITYKTDYGKYCEEKGDRVLRIDSLYKIVREGLSDGEI